jgi:hypothetical protein
MKIIIKLKKTATPLRIIQYTKALKSIGDGNIHTDDFSDVVESFDLEN